MQTSKQREFELSDTVKTLGIVLDKALGSLIDHVICVPQRALRRLRGIYEYMLRSVLPESVRLRLFYDIWQQYLKDCTMTMDVACDADLLPYKLCAVPEGAAVPGRKTMRWRQDRLTQHRQNDPLQFIKMKLVEGDFLFNRFK
ncbi:hypothetical protein J6590_087393 [Homalodisca vitripennis]|nr:hypothetical protein J6590_087393 [Homalodisca vitripennis]